MPRRMIDGEIRKSASLARVSIEAGHVFVLLMTCADDQGRTDGDPLILRSELFPRRRDISDDHVEKLLDELLREGCLHRYVVGGDAFIHFPAWETYQRLRNRSKERRPDPAEHCAGCNPEVAVLPLGFSPVSPPQKSRHTINRRAKNSERTMAPDALLTDQIAALRVWCEQKQPDELGRLSEHVATCLDHFRGTGERKADWVSVCRNWVRRAKTFEGGVNGNARNPRGGGRSQVGPIERAARELADLARS